MSSKEKKSPNFWSCRTTAAIIGFILVNLALHAILPEKKAAPTAREIQTSTNERCQKGSWIWWITRDYLLDGQNADIVFMGSSQMGSALYSAEAGYLQEAVDTVTHRNSCYAEHVLSTIPGGRPPATFNMAFGGAMISDQFMLAKALFNEDHKPKLVVIGLNPRDFMDNSFPSVNATEAFAYLRSYVDLEQLSNSAFTDLFSWLNWQLGELPERRLGTRLMATLPSLENKILGPLPVSNRDGKPSAAGPGGETNEAEALKAIYGNNQEVTPGKWKVVASTWGAFQDNTKEYKMRYMNPNPAIYPIEKRFFEALLAHFKKENINVLVVGMPSLWPNRALLPDRFWNEFRSSVASATAKYGGTYLDLSDSKQFVNTDYLDTVHLNPNGGYKIVRFIAKAIESNPRLSSALQNRRLARKAPPRVSADYWQ